MIVIVDYGMGNLRSVANALKKIQVEAVITSDPAEIAQAEKLILPGVGAFDQGMENLETAGLVPALKERVVGRGVPVLGICLGLHLLTRRSDEGRMAGLGWLDAETIELDQSSSASPIKVPHMGWNTVERCADTPLLASLGEQSTFYFAHSYHLRCEREGMTVARTHYGVDFPSIVNSRNIIGTQFHPEKSRGVGLRLLANFAGRF